MYMYVKYMKNIPARQICKTYTYSQKKREKIIPHLLEKNHFDGVTGDMAMSIYSE